jgi:hypothetical protein
VLTQISELLRVVEAKIMSLKKGYRPMIFGTFLDVNVCSKVFGAVLRRVFEWEKSMVFRSQFSAVSWS